MILVYCLIPVMIIVYGLIAGITSSAMRINKPDGEFDAFEILFGVVWPMTLAVTIVAVLAVAPLYFPVKAGVFLGALPWWVKERHKADHEKIKELEAVNGLGEDA